VLPLLILVVLIIAQLATIAYAQLAVTHSAREVARTLATDRDADLGHLTDLLGGADVNNLEIEFDFQVASDATNELVLVQIEYQVAPISPVFSAFSDRFIVRAESKMRIESQKNR